MKQILFAVLLLVIGCTPIENNSIEGNTYLWTVEYESHTKWDSYQFIDEELCIKTSGLSSDYDFVEKKDSLIYINNEGVLDFYKENRYVYSATIVGDKMIINDLIFILHEKTN